MRRMKFLFLFMDGVGLGLNDLEHNPLVSTEFPNLKNLLGGKSLVAENVPLESERASVIAIDPNLGVDGLPQSATGQGSLVTGKNVPKLIGEHYGPKPNKAVRAIIEEDNLFIALSKRGYRSALLNAYPEGYFQGIESGRRLLSAIPLAVSSAGIALKTAEDLNAGEAFSVDFTGRGWRDQLGYKDSPVMEGREAGRKLAKVVESYDLAFFEFWVSDYAGHHQDHEAAKQLLENFDAVLSGLLEVWNDDEGLILITSDHGNMENLGSRRHTDNQVPALVIGAKKLRDRFTQELRDLSDVTPAILQFYPDISETL
jgi:hypothetical protein